jgi:hypothetical protein
MRKWKAEASLSLWLALFLLILALAGTAVFGAQVFAALNRPPADWLVDGDLLRAMLAFVILALISGTIAYRLATRLTLFYEIDRNGLYISWLGNRATVPLDQIEQIDSGNQVRTPWQLFQGIGVYWGRGRLADGRMLHLYSSRRPARALLIATAESAYVLAPVNADDFVQEIEQRRKLGATRPVRAEIASGRWFYYNFWSDQRISQALLLGLLLNLLMLSILAISYARLPPELAMRFDAGGNIAELRPRHQILFLPLAGLMIYLINIGLGLAIYRREPGGARMLQIASIVVQILFAVAIVGIAISL